MRGFREQKKKGVNNLFTINQIGQMARSLLVVCQNLILTPEPRFISLLLVEATVERYLRKDQKPRLKSGAMKHRIHLSLLFRM